MPPTLEIRLSSNVAKVIQLFKKHPDGTLKEWWTEIPLNTGDYKELKMLLERRGNLFNCVNDKVRYENYFVFCFESPTAIRNP